MDNVIDKFVEKYPIDLSVKLLKILAHPSQGGLGYRLEMFNPLIDMDGWEVDHTKKLIQIDRTGMILSYTKDDHAQYLKYAIETEILKTRASLLSRIGWGTGKILVGVVEGVVGLVGIIVPEPGTTAGGVVVLTLGVNSIADGLSQLAGANQGHGINILGESFGVIGATTADLANLNPEVGRKIGKGVFFVTSIAAGSIGSIKVLHVPGKAIIKSGVGGMPGGLQLGRLDLLYKSERALDGLTVLSITDNAGRSILRFVTHGGKLVVNGRIVGVSRVLTHETNAKSIVKGILKLLVNGAKH